MSLAMSPVEDNIPVVCIVGGGFSGVALAWHLLSSIQKPTRILLINKGAQIGHGLAYGTPSPHHLLNVPAGRMGISPHDESGFLRYLQRLGLPFAAGDFVPRSLYGAYLENVLGEAQEKGSKFGAQLQVIAADVVDVEVIADTQYIVSLNDGRRLAASVLVLALGNFAAALPYSQPGLTWQEPGLHASAWSLSKWGLADLKAPVLLMGSGLTAFDALLQLRHQGHRGPVTMLSRRGLMAQAHRRHESPPPKGIVPPEVMKDHRSARAMLREIRHRIRNAQVEGHDWRDVIGGLRESTPRLWQQLPLAERSRFLRHLAPYWETHRHRAAVAIASAVRQEIESGTLTVMAGRLRCLLPQGAHWVATIARRNSGDLLDLNVGAVVNCTGPSSNVKATRDSLIQSLLLQGRLSPDELALGVQVDDSYQLLAATGKGQKNFHYLGPLLKATLWEATAVPELRVHALRLAAVIRCGLGGDDMDVK
jgi:uncharacterized NAD(P)/FAD-binding protein YdhS